MRCKSRIGYSDRENKFQASGILLTKGVWEFGASPREVLLGASLQFLTRLADASDVCMSTNSDVIFACPQTLKARPLPTYADQTLRNLLRADHGISLPGMSSINHP